MNRRTALKMMLSGAVGSFALPRILRAAGTDKDTVSAEHGMIGGQENLNADASHTGDPGAQWYPDAGFGLFLHWGICSVRGMNISWSMIPGRALAKRRLSPDELARVIKEQDWNLNGQPPEITPNEYWSMANDFNPREYDPNKWCTAAKAAGFGYVVLTTKHHEGFAQWPSAFGNFNTKNFMGGKDLVKDYVQACRDNNLKAGLYFSGPDWHFDREYMSFLYGGAYRQNPTLPKLDADLKPRVGRKSPDEISAHQKEFAALVKGQIEELLTRYGKIDLIWFDGKPAIPNPAEAIPMSRIRELQPSIVVNGRLHGHGDFFTYERTMPRTKTVRGWAELCDPWTGAWPYTTGEHYRSNAWVLGELCRCRALGINLLLGIGPMSNGDLAAAAYENMAILAGWMTNHRVAVGAVNPLDAAESASVPASAKGATRYLYAIPEFDGGNTDADMQPVADVKLTLKGVAKPTAVTLLGDSQPIDFDYSDGLISVRLPAARRNKLVDVVAIQLA